VRYLLILTLLVGCSAHPPITNDTTNLVQAAFKLNPHDGVYQIDGRTQSASAFPVGCRAEGEEWRVHFITTGHIRDDKFTVRHHDMGDVGAFDKLDRHDKADVAVFSILSPHPIVPREIDYSPVRFGDPLLTSGYHMGVDVWMHPGRASTPGKIGAEIHVGCSGGPVARPNGDVVGLNEGVLSIAEQTISGCSYYQPLRYLRDWITEQIK